MPYEERCTLLNWNTLEHRREYLSLVECYKTVFGLNGLNFNEYFEYCKSKITRANHQHKIQLKSARVNCFKYSFFVRIVKHWNDLPNHLFNEGHNINNFKKNLEKHMNIMNSKSPVNFHTVGNFDPMNFEYNAKVFNAYVCKCKQFYSMLISTKAKTPNSFKKLIADFKLSNPQKIFSIPYRTASETYVWSFQYRMLNFILFTNDKLFKIGLSDSDKCSFCGTYSENLYHLFFNCSTVRAFWNRFTVWWSDLGGENLSLTLKDIIIGLLHRTDVLNYLIILGKITQKTITDFFSS